MRISTANIPAQATKASSSTSTQTVGQSIDRRQAFASDSYTRNAQQSSPEIIDAEFVEFYSPSTKIFNKERSNLDFSIVEEGPIEHSAAVDSTGPAPPKIERYQQTSSPDTPQPGTFIDIFA